MAKTKDILKRLIFNSAYRSKQRFGWWPMKKWGENEKKDWVEEVGEKKMAAVFHTVMIA